MFTRIPCNGCGRRLKLPYGADPHKARCPSCGQRIDPVGESGMDTPLPLGPLAPVAEILTAKVISLPKPGPAPLSLDDTDTLLSLDDDPAPAGPIGPFPPLRFAAVVRSDSRAKNAFTGRLDVVATPHGLFLESPGRPFLYLPVGTPGEVIGPGEIMLTAAGRVLELRFVNSGNPNRLARDIAALMAGQPLILSETDYRRPAWLLALAAGFAATLIVGPAVLAETVGHSLELGIAVGATFATLGLLVNLLIAFHTRFSIEWKLLLMAGSSVALTALFAVGAFAYFRAQPQAGESLGPDDKPEGPPPAPLVEYPVLPPQPPPPTYLDLAREKGMATIEEGPANTTALALIPGRAALLAGYEDGSTRVWPLDRPTFDGWAFGPKGDGPPRGITWTDGGKTAVIAGPRATVLAPFDSPPQAPLRIAGERVAVLPGKAKERDRFAVLRSGLVQVRSIPAGLPAKPVGKSVNGFVPLASRQETADGAYRFDLQVSPKITFLAWHPNGLLFAGQADGVVLIAKPGARVFVPENPTHKAPIRVVAQGATRPDFALGDDQGVVSFWANGSLLPTKHKLFATAVTALAIDAQGTTLAAADASGNVVLRDVAKAENLATLKHYGTVRALAFGPNDETLCLASGKGIEVLMRAELEKTPDGPMPVENGSPARP